MRPSELQPAHFEVYPPLGRKLAKDRIQLLRRMPLAFLPLLLREMLAYDWKFPAEKKELDRQFSYLESLAAHEFLRTMRPFESLRLPAELEQMNWVNTPGEFSEKLTAHLWATHQLDSFRGAAIDYVRDYNAFGGQSALPLQRLAMVVIGQGVQESAVPLFRKLRPHGTHYKRVKPERGFDAILQTAVSRAEAHLEAYSHWYIDGGSKDPKALARLTSISYGSLTPARTLLQTKIRDSFQSGVGSETLRTTLAGMRPEDLGLSGTATGAELNHLELSLLTEGSGTQIFSTTFVQWAAREVLRRAQPLTLVARFAPRQREKSMKELLTEAQQKPELDPAGSLIDADMGAYYTWLNQQRLSGADQAGFLVWFENHNEGLVIGPSVQKGASSDTPVSIEELIRKTA